MINILLKRGEDYKAFHSLLEGYVFRSYGSGRIVTVEAELDSFPLADNPSVERCYENRELDVSPQYSTRTLPNTHHRPTGTPNEDSWALARITRRNNPYYNIVDGYVSSPVSTEYAWGRTGNGVDCYVIDAGMYPSHPCFTGRVTWVSDGSTTREDSPDTHGQNTASMMAGVGVGVATDALIWYVQSSFSSVTEADWLQQYDDVLQHYLGRASTNRPAVLNHSFAGPGFGSAETPAVTALVGEMVDAGLIICIASGNLTYNADSFNVIPLEYDPDTIGVGSIGPDDTLMDYTKVGGFNDGQRIGSTTGEAVKIYGPGVGVMGAQTSTGYEQVNGTSFATPYTAGVVACMLQGYQRLNHREQVKSVIRKLIQNSTKDKVRYNPNEKGVVNNRILYIDPTLTFEDIPGLEAI